ncbi:MAG TPA: 16S rRNA (guanine(966)-N(2))-methyltransferase RsmD [Acetobacteraceae bacterium]|nr:16S rRNA (guanine(966)-N(2))-methyltransferase RsmD [Acetobacteraceae bacterium]
MRIVGGAWRGRRLVAPPGAATRPTADRVRQALFDMLLHAPWGGWALIEGATVLDAFAGSGALGLEALSRGAARAAFIERDPAALRALRANIAGCGAGRASTVIASDAFRPPSAPGPCAVVFLDPPYAVPAGPALAALAAAGWIAPGTLIVAETAREAASPAPGPALAERAHGAAKLTIWRAGSEMAPALR